MEREIEVSQWGNVAVEEVVHARNSGTPLTGEFSRLDYFRSDPDTSASWGSIFACFFTRLAERPHRQARSRHLLSRHHRQRDHQQRPQGKRGRERGSLHALPHDGRVEDRVLLGVRLGGGLHRRYNLHSGRVLRKENNRFQLKVPYSTPLMQADVAELSVRVVLPECVKNVQFELPEGVEQPTLDYR